MSKRRVVVTGMGIISPIGNDLKTAWENVVSGVSGVRPIEAFDVSAFTTRFGGCVQGFDAAEGGIPPKEARKVDQFIQYGIVACNQAIADSGIEVRENNAHRMGVLMGAGIGGIGTIEGNYKKYLDADANPRKISPFFVPGSIINMISGHISIMHGMTGPNLSVVTACTTSTHALALAARTIAYGDADVMLAGGAEYATTPLGLGGFCSARALSTRNDDPQRASRPFDADLQEALGRPVRVANDANCFALSEATDGAGAGAGVVFGVILGTGVGGGLVVNGKVIGGRNGVTAEWGHIPRPCPTAADRPGPQCYCGRRGGLETWLSGPALAADFARVVGAGEGDGPAAREIADLAEAGDPEAEAAIARHSDRFGRALGTLINIVDPDVIVLGGGLSNLPGLAERAQAAMTPHVFSDSVATEIRANVHGDSSGVRGAAWLWDSEERLA